MQPHAHSSLKWIRTRSFYISLYSLSRISLAQPSSSMPYTVIALLFLFTHPSTPPISPDNIVYSIVVVVFSWLVIELHLPIQPSPLFLLPQDFVLPLAVLVWRSVSRIFLPVITFFLPALTLSFFLLSLSLSGLALPFDLAALPAPMESRVGLLFLSTMLSLLLWCSLTMPVLLYPFIASESVVAASLWDRYSKPVGLEARRVFAHAVALRAGPTSFPAPLNLVQLLAVRLPTCLLRVAGRRDLSSRIGVVEQVIWTALVAPLAVTVAGLWGWGLW